jgi:hypothetical protein
MDDTALVEHGERPRDARGDREGVAQRQRPPLEPARQCLTLEPFHGEIAVSRIARPVRHVADDAGMDDLREERPFAQESLRRVGTEGREELERHALSGEQITRRVHGAHAASAREAFDLEATGHDGAGACLGRHDPLTASGPRVAPSAGRHRPCRRRRRHRRSMSHRATLPRSLRGHFPGLRPRSARTCTRGRLRR